MRWARRACGRAMAQGAAPYLDKGTFQVVCLGLFQLLEAEDLLCEAGVTHALVSGERQRPKQGSGWWRSSRDKHPSSRVPFLRWGTSPQRRGITSRHVHEADTRLPPVQPQPRLPVATSTDTGVNTAAVRRKLPLRLEGTQKKCCVGAQVRGGWVTRGFHLHEQNRHGQGDAGSTALLPRLVIHHAIKISTSRAESLLPGLPHGIRCQTPLAHRSLRALRRRAQSSAPPPWQRSLPGSTAQV